MSREISNRISNLKKEVDKLENDFNKENPDLFKFVVTDREDMQTRSFRLTLADIDCQIAMFESNEIDKIKKQIAILENRLNEEKNMKELIEDGMLLRKIRKSL